MPDTTAAESSTPVAPLPQPQTTPCGICGLPADLVDDGNEELMSVLLAWWMEGPLTEDTGPAAAMEDMRAFLRHIEDAGFYIVRPDMSAVA